MDCPTLVKTNALSFICGNGCGVCKIKLVDFVNHATQAQPGDPWVVVASTPTVVSECCGEPVEVFDDRTGEAHPLGLIDLGTTQDAERYRWLVGARSKEECADENAGSCPALPQDHVIADLASWYRTKEEADAAIDAARGVTEQAPQPGTPGTPR